MNKRNKIILTILIVLALMYFFGWFTRVIIFDDFQVYRDQLEIDTARLEQMKEEVICKYGFLEEYRCNGDDIEQKYQFSNCSFLWM